MDTSATSSSSSKTLVNRRHGKRMAQDFEPRIDFKLIRYLEPAEATSLDKLHDDLQESIERTVQVHQAFVKKLTKHAVPSNWIKGIIQIVDEIPFHCDLQRKIVGDGITQVLKPKETEAKRLKEETAAKKRDVHNSNCTNCYICANW